MCEYDVDGYFEGCEKPTPGGLALWLGVEGRLGEVAARDVDVLRGLHRIVAYAEGCLYEKVQGPLAVIARCEALMGVLEVDSGMDGELYAAS